MSEQPTRLPAGDWPEDFKHENGNYMCQCFYCKHIFFGHKRRVVCKVCAALPSDGKLTDQSGG